MTAEIINPVIKRVDAVDGPATGMPFLILKSNDLPEQPVVKDAEADPAEGIETTNVDGPHIDGTDVPDDEANAAAPGTPAWEATDAAKARTAVDALVQVRDRVRELAAREGAEAAGGDDGDTYSQWDLEDACGALDFALATLAKFAVDEQSEADNGQQAAEADARALGLIKSLNRRLNTEETTVTDQTETVTKTEAEPPVVEKADEPMVAVYDKNGNLLGAVQSDSLTPLAVAPDADSDAATEGDAPAEPAPAAEPVTEAAATPEAAPAAAPAPEPVAPAAPAPDDQTVNKSLDDRVAEAVAKALEAAVATAVEPLVKSNAELAERVEKMAQTPRSGGPMLAGQVPSAIGNNPALRGHADETAELRKQLAEQADPGKAVLGVAGLIRQGWQNQ